MKARSALFAGCALALAGCAMVAGLDVDVEPTGAGGASGTGTSTSAGGGTTGGCALSVPPQPPAKNDAVTSASFTVAVRTVNFGEDPGSPVRSYDLDGRCTCPGPYERPTEEYPVSCQPAKGLDDARYCDLAGGADVQSVKLFDLLNVSGTTSKSASSDAERGAWSLLFKVDDYNSQPNDKTVTVSVFNGQRTSSTPKWDGTDLWPVDSFSVNNGSIDQPTFTTDTAFVSNGVLVASLSGAALTVRAYTVGQIVIDLDGAYITGRIVQKPAGFALEDGVFSAKWNIEKALRGLDVFRLPDGKSLCTDNSVFDVLLGTICNSLDVNTGAPNIGQKCDALSFGLNFTADPVQLGPIVELPPPPGACVPGTEPSTETCPFLQ